MEEYLFPTVESGVFTTKGAFQPCHEMGIFLHTERKEGWSKSFQLCYCVRKTKIIEKR